LVLTWLVTVSIGFAPAGNSAAMIPTELALLLKSFAVPPSALNVFESVFWKGV
jgi:hypothetical protein